MKFSLSLAVLLLVSISAYAMQTDNRGIHAVPASKPIVIDGKLDEWDLSGQTLICYDVQSLRDVYSTEAALTYDAENLYVSLHWKDPIPMGNSHDPRYAANKGWAGDAVQMRFKTDRISHLTAWYFAPKQEPTLQISYGKSLTEPFGGGDIQLFQTQGWKLQQGVEMAFLKDADNRGYVQEMKLPWKLITNDGKPHAQFNLGFELLWGEADWPVHRYADNLQPGKNSREFFWTAHDAWGPVWLEKQGNLKLPVPAWLKPVASEEVSGPVEIRYSLPKAARVTLAIDDPKTGRRIRNLVASAQREAGNNVEKWDGLDDDGNPVAPGEYSYKAIYHDGLHANYVMSFANPGNPTWSTPDGHGGFYSDHTAPQAAAAAGEFVALACPMAEAGQFLIGLDLNGQRLWGLNNRVAFDGGRVALATDGKVLYVASEGKESLIYRVEMATGKYAPWNKTAKDTSGADYKLLELKVSDLPGIKADPKAGANMTGVVLRGGVLAVALARENKIKILDAQTGDVQREYSVPAPQTVVFDEKAQPIVLSQGRLVRLTDKGSTAFSDAIFTDGYGLTTDAQGNIYVSTRGENQNVKVLSAGGKVLREIGKRGGRPSVGRYDASGMREPAGLAVDSKNRLWVTEETMNPKRTSVWNTASGQLEKEFVGTTTYAGAGSINPFDATMAFSDNTMYRINLASGAWQPEYSLAGGDIDQSLYQNLSDDLFPPATHSILSKIVKRGNATLIYSTSSARGANEVHATLWDGKAFRSVAHFGVVAPLNDRQMQRAKFNHPFFAGQENKTFSWIDANGDGRVQRDELTFTDLQVDGKAVSLQSAYWGQLPDDEGTITYMARDKSGLLKDTLLQFPISGTNQFGAPIYNIASPRVLKLDQPILNPGSGMTLGGKDGRVYINQMPLIAIERDGRVLSSYPNRNLGVHGSHTATTPRPGYLIGPSSILGAADMGREIGEVFYLNGNLGENYLFTHDGLFIQSLFKDTRGYFDTPLKAVHNMSMDAITAGGESFGGNFIRTSDGKTYVTLGTTDARVMEVTGLQTIKRLSGKFTYTPAEYSRAQALLAQGAAKTQEPKVFTIARSTQPVTLDGKADEWPELLDDKKALLEIQETAQQRFGRVSARYDANNLYLGYRVFSTQSNLRNAGQDEKLLFKTGDVVDVMLGPSATTGQTGNVRLLMTLMAGKPTAVLYEKSVAGTKENARVPFSSPWRTIYFDRVTRLNDVQMASGPIAGGYFVEAAIPWRVLGVQPQSGLKLRGDVGALSADAGGTQTVARRYWSNKATNLVNDVPGEADLSPELWGTFTLE